jgi:hypothetical protein
MWEANAPRAQRAPNNNVDGPNEDVFDKDGFSDEHPVRSAYCGNYLPTPSNEGVCNVYGSEDYDDIHSGDEGSDSNKYNGNDDEAPNNGASSDEVQGALYGQNNNVLEEPQELPI